MNNKESLINRLKKLESLIADTLTAIKGLPEVDFDYTVMTINEPGQLTIVMDCDIKNYDDLANYRNLRKSLESDYDFHKKWFHGELGSWFIELKHKALDVRLDIKMQFKEEKEGQSCKLVIDYYEKPRPVYKVECD